MEIKFLKIKNEYEKFRNQRLSKGKLMVKDTGKGFWGPAITDEIFEIFKKVKLDQHKSFIDLGSGDGRAVLIASLFTNATGIEHDEELHSKAMEMQRNLSIPAMFINGDYYEHDLSKYDVLFVNPDIPFYRGLEDKLKKELKGKLIVYDALYRPTNLKKVDEFEVNGTKVAVFENK